MEHPENSEEYKGLTVNSGVTGTTIINPYLQRGRFKRREMTADEMVEGIVKGDVTILSQAVTLVESIHLNGNKAKQTANITIENIGRSELDISSLQMFTTGLKVKLNKTRLQPGEQATLKITAETKTLRAARSKPRVLMITNDPMKPKVVINIEQ